jgi:hypothetical protein
MSDFWMYKRLKLGFHCFGVPRMSRIEKFMPDFGPMKALSLCFHW